MAQVTCSKCGWVHMGVTLAYARAEVARFNEAYYSWPADTQSHYSGPASIKAYARCWCGEPHTGMRPYKEGDCPDGVTIGPILLPDEVYPDVKP